MFEVVSRLLFSEDFDVEWLAQFSLSNVHKRGLKHHHFISDVEWCRPLFEKSAQHAHFCPFLGQIKKSLEYIFD